MARTDIHRPLHALWRDPGMRSHFREFHHHPRGVCDLDVFLAAFQHGGWARTLCRVSWWSEQRICACANCSMRAARRRTRRRERQITRRQLRGAAAEWAAGQLDEDGPWPFRAASW